MCSDTTALPSRQSTLSMIFVHNQTFYKSWAFLRSIAVSPPDSSAFLQASAACSTAQRTAPTSASSSAASRARRGSPFSQPDDVFTLNRDLPTLALAWCLSRARCGSWSSDRRSFSVTATRPRPPDEMGCQDGGHSGFEGCARNFCGCQHCCFLLRAGMTASPLSAFKTFYASTLRPRSGGRHLTWGKNSRQSAPVTAFSMPSPSGIVISGHCPRSLRQSLTAVSH